MTDLDYKTCQLLKDAGFPQTPGDYWIDTETVWDKGTQSEYETPSTLPRSKWVKCPLLEELIEACGKQFGQLVNVDTHWNADANTGREWLLRQGPTPIKAVVALYLALNKK